MQEPEPVNFQETSEREVAIQAHMESYAAEYQERLEREELPEDAIKPGSPELRELAGRFIDQRDSQERQRRLLALAAQHQSGGRNRAERRKGLPRGGVEARRATKKTRQADGRARNRAARKARKKSR